MIDGAQAAFFLNRAFVYAQEAEDWAKAGEYIQAHWARNRVRNMLRAADRCAWGPIVAPMPFERG